MPATSHRAPDPRPARTRASIYRSARRLSERGEPVTANAVAIGAGVSRAALYSHFTGLDSLLLDLLKQLVEEAYATGRSLRTEERGTEEMVRIGFGSLVAVVEKNQGFLRGALSWRVSHHPTMFLLDELAEHHAEGLRAVGATMPGVLTVEATARWIAGGELSLVDVWLRDTAKEAAASGDVDASSLLATILAAAPPWYTGTANGEACDAAALLDACRTALKAV